MIQKVLVADDDPLDRQLIQEILLTIDDRVEVQAAPDGERAFAALEKDSFDLVFTDMKMPGKGGLQVLEKAKAACAGCEVVVVTGHGDISSAVEAMKKGSFDYLLKPICVDEIELLMGRLCEHKKLVEENEYLRAELAGAGKASGIIGQSKAIKEASATAIRVSVTDATVLLQGESGTGKELFGRLIHSSSPRRKRPFVRVNCAALSESILESELFGHEKGAFTGAYASKPGRFELADGGTLLLDEVSETSEKLQAELLRVIEQKEFERVGGTRTMRVDVRIIATTNLSLAAEAAEGRFRKDLFYRLNVFPVVLPPLRERDGDIELLTGHFARKFARRLGKPVPEIRDEAMATLRGYAWPGNVRELENLLQRLVIMDDNGVIESADIPAYVEGGSCLLSDAFPWAGTLEDVEREAILRTLRQVDGNRTHAAEKLKISTRTIRNKLQKYMKEGYLGESFS